MKRWLKRIRGAVGTGLTWAAAWSGVGAILSLVIGGFVGFYATVFAIMGFVGGAVFSGVLGITEGRRTFDEMSLSRFAVWGAVGGVAVGGILVSMLFVGGPLTLGSVLIAGVVTLMGAGSAAGSLALARRANPLLESGEGLGLLEGETPDPST